METSLFCPPPQQALVVLSCVDGQRKIDLDLYFFFRPLLARSYFQFFFFFSLPSSLAAGFFLVIRCAFQKSFFATFVPPFKGPLSYVVSTFPPLCLTPFEDVVFPVSFSNRGPPAHVLHPLPPLFFPPPSAAGDVHLLFRRNTTSNSLFTLSKQPPTI